MSELPPTPPPDHDGAHEDDGQAPSRNASLTDRAGDELLDKDTQEFPMTTHDEPGEEGPASDGDTSEEESPDELKSLVLSRVRETREQLLQLIDDYAQRQAERAEAQRRELEARERELLEREAAERERLEQQLEEERQRAAESVPRHELEQEKEALERERQRVAALEEEVQRLERELAERTAHATPLAAVAAPIPVRAGAAEAPHSEDSLLAELRRSFAHLDEANTQSELLSRLLEEATRFAERSALLLVHQDTGEQPALRLWNACGFSAPASLEISVPADWQRAFAGHALRGDAALGRDLTSALEAAAPSDVLILPFVLRDETRALLYVDRTADGEPFSEDALQLLCFTGEQALEVLPLRSQRPAGSLTEPHWVGHLSIAEESAGDTAGEITRDAGDESVPAEYAEQAVEAREELSPLPALEDAELETVEESEAEPHATDEAPPAPDFGEIAAEADLGTDTAATEPVDLPDAASAPTELFEAPPPFEEATPREAAEDAALEPEPPSTEAIADPPALGDDEGVAAGDSESPFGEASPFDTQPSLEAPEIDAETGAELDSEAATRIVPLESLPSIEEPELSIDDMFDDAPGIGADTDTAAEEGADELVDASAAGFDLEELDESALPPETGPLVLETEAVTQEVPLGDLDFDEAPPTEEPAEASDAAETGPESDDTAPDSLGTGSESATEIFATPPETTPADADFSPGRAAVASLLSSSTEPMPPSPPAPPPPPVLPAEAPLEPPPPEPAEGAEPDVATEPVLPVAAGASETVEASVSEPQVEPPPISGTPEVQPPGDLGDSPGWAFSRSEEGAGEQAHEEARRLARLLVSELQLYNEEQIDEGRRRGNIYQYLKEDIDKSRSMYEERVDEQVRQSTDYFREELVRSLADGDARLLGL